MFEIKKIALVGAQTQEPECTHWLGIKKGMQSIDVEYYEIDFRSLGPEETLKAINSIKDLDLLIWGLQDPFEYPRLIREAKAKVRTFWFAELRDERTGGFPKHDMTEQIDFGLTSAAGVIPLYEKHTLVPWFFLPQAGFEGEKVESQYANCDCVFIGGKIEGGLHGQRYRMIQQIDFPITHLNEQVLSKRMDLYKQMPTIYGTAKICFDASQVWDVEGYCSARYFHIAANGGFSICKWFPGCEDLFPSGVGKIYFNTPQEAAQLLTEYSHPSKAFIVESMAREGKEHALAHHTYRNRIKRIFEIIEKVCPTMV